LADVRPAAVQFFHKPEQLTDLGFIPLRGNLPNDIHDDLLSISDSSRVNHGSNGFIEMTPKYARFSEYNASRRKFLNFHMIPLKQKPLSIIAAR
jgi:hypothetical protein